MTVQNGHVATGLVYVNDRSLAYFFYFFLVRAYFTKQVNLQGDSRNVSSVCSLDNVLVFDKVMGTG